MDYLIGIDLGSTNLKTVVYTPDGACAASASTPMELQHPDPAHPDWATWDPDLIWNGIGRLLKEVVAQLDDPSGIKAVAVTGMAGRTTRPLLSFCTATTDGSEDTIPLPLR